MRQRSIRTIAGLQRACNASNRRSARLYKRPYILQPALIRHLAQFDRLDRIVDPAARFQAFRIIPALEYDLEAVDATLTADQHESLAQRDRAMRPRNRLTEDGQTLETIIFNLLNQATDPWRQKAKQYWLPVFYRLRLLGLNPTFMTDPVRGSEEWLEYDGRSGARRSLTRGQFENIVSKVRRRFSRGPQLTASG